MKRIISLIICLSICFAMTVPAWAETNENDDDFSNKGYEAGIIGEQSSEDKEFSDAKRCAVQEIYGLVQMATENGGELSSLEIDRLEALLACYYPDAKVEDYLALSHFDGSRSTNPGDHITMSLNLPGQVQQNNYYCGPASGCAVLRGRGINVTQSQVASQMGTTTNGTPLHNVAPGLNHWNGTNGNHFHYATLVGYKLSGENMTAQEWAMLFTNSAITTILGQYGVIYNVHQVAGSMYYLQGYSNSSGLASSSLSHFVAGEGFDSSNPSSRVCYYYDSNNLKTNLGNRHMHVSFQTMAVLCNDRGLIY